MEDRDIRAALDRHWTASDANDFEAEHQIYREDAVLEYPQSGERIRGLASSWSLTSTRSCRSQTMIVSSNPLSVWRMQFDASSETISATSARVSAGASRTAIAANLRAAVTDSGACANLRLCVIASPSAGA